MHRPAPLTVTVGGGRGCEVGHGWEKLLELGLECGLRMCAGGTEEAGVGDTDAYKCLCMCMLVCLHVHVLLVRLGGGGSWVACFSSIAMFPGTLTTLWSQDFCTGQPEWYVFFFSLFQIPIYMKGE